MNRFLAVLLLASVAPATAQESVVAPPPRRPLPRPVADAPLTTVNQNQVAAGRYDRGTLTLTLDVVEAAWRAEGDGDPVVRVLALAESGKAPTIPGPMLRVPAGTTVRLALRNRTDSALTFSGFRRDVEASADTVQLAAGATRTLTFRLDSVGTWFYWGALKGLSSWRQRDWLDSQLNGALIVDPAGSPFGRFTDRVWVVSEWFHSYPDKPFESVLVFNGRAWPHNERLTYAQGDSVHWRIINAAAIEHPMHLHGFYFRVTHRGGERADTAIPFDRQALQNMQVMAQGGTMQIAWLQSTPGNWVFHCHFASHVGDDVSLHGSPDAHLHGATDAAGHGPAGHQMRGLVIGMHVTPRPGYREDQHPNRRVVNLFAYQWPGQLPGGQTAYGFAMQTGDSAPPRDSMLIPGPVLELRRDQPVRIVVHNRMTEPTGVHWHGLEIESFPDGVPGFSGIGNRIMPAIEPGSSFAAEFTPPRSGTFPYHAHLHELRQIGSGMYGAILVTDAPRDSLRDHLVVAGGGGLPVFAKGSMSTLLVNGRATPRPIRMIAGDTNRIRLVSIHADWILRFRLGDDERTAQWVPLARDGADLPPALRTAQLARVEMGPGETADYLYVPPRPGRYLLEVWMWPLGQRVEVPIEAVAR